MAHSDPNYGKPIKWGNVKKIEVTKQVFVSLFNTLNSMKQEIEHLRISVSNISSEKDKEIAKLKSEIQILKSKDGN